MSRLAKKQLRAADRGLSAPLSDEGIHKARTSIKKTRAILRLFKKNLAGRYRSANRHLRQAGHLLSELRDLDAMDDTLRVVFARYHSLLARASVNKVAAALQSSGRQAKSAAGQQVSAAVRELRRVRHGAPGALRRVGSRTKLLAGAVEGYRQVLEAMRDLELSSQDAAFHQWRKRVKDHWYQVRLFEGLHRGARQRAGRLEKLERLLGDEHNLVVLRQRLLEDQLRDVDSRTITLLLGCIAKYQRSLRRHTLKLGRALFNLRPAAMSESLENWSRRA